RERRADLLPARAPEPAAEPRALELAQLPRGRHTRLRDPLPRVDELAVCRGDRRDERDAVALEQEPQERTDRHGLVVRRGREGGGAPTERDSRVAERFDGRAVERLGDPVERGPVGAHGLLRRGEVEHGLGVAPRRGAAYGHRSDLLAGELRPGLVEGSFDELPMPLGRDLAPEHAARGEDDHGRELAAELRERLIVQLLRVGPTPLADAVSLGLRLRAQIGGRRLRGFCRAVRDLLRLAPRLGEHRLDLGRQPLAFGLRRLRRGDAEAFREGGADDHVRADDRRRVWVAAHRFRRFRGEDAHADAGPKDAEADGDTGGEPCEVHRGCSLLRYLVMRPALADARSRPYVTRRGALPRAPRATRSRG